MTKGFLSNYFEGVAVKHLAAVEVDCEKSNQHEFNGVAALKKILGSSPEKFRFDAKFIYLNDHDDPKISEGFLTWYDARKDHPKRTEWRLYFSDTNILFCAAEGDLLIIGKRPDNQLVVIVARKNSTIENQLHWLFDIPKLDDSKFFIKEDADTDSIALDLTRRLILEELGEEIEDVTDESFLDLMIERFGEKFPKTKEFSDFSCNTIKDITSWDDPDEVLLTWIEREEVLFKTFEKHLMAEQLRKGFNNDVDLFINFSLSVHNRRKSRAGWSLENHMSRLFGTRGIRYAHGAVTENRNKPDFIFPSKEDYHNFSFDPFKLTLLAVKTTCKDRWRQVLSEANRIENKHLLTLEPGISEPQTDQMKNNKLQLVIPQRHFPTYTKKQQSWLINIKTFIDLVSEKQK